MKYIFIAVFAVILLLIIAFFCTTYYLYRYVFYSRTKKAPNTGPALNTEKYNSYRDTQRRRIEEFKSMEHEPVQISSYDGLTLRGRFFSCEGSENCVIIFHGYRSHINADGALITKYCLDKGFNVLAVHQRSHDISDGKTITFGIKERYDCKSWIDYIVQRLGNDARIMLMGVSMGAATVMMASELSVPNVKGIIADCGYTSPKAILKTVIKRLGYPEPAYTAIRMSAKIYGGFDPDKASSTKALSKSNIPITIIHGDCDGYVPCDMAHECFNAAKAKNKKLVIIPEATHGVSYYFDTYTYEKAVDEMLITVMTSN